MKHLSSSLVLVLSIALAALTGQSSAHSATTAPSIQPPILKWQRGGCYSSWCETGWYSSPAVADLDGDGKPDVVGSAYSIVALEGDTGALKWRVGSGHDRSEPGASSVGRTWPGIVIADVDGDSRDEIVTAHSGGYVSVYNANGYFESGWPNQVAFESQHPELRSLAVADLDRDGRLDIVAGGAYGNRTNTWVFGHDGSLRAGWPQLGASAPGSAWGVYNSNVALGDLDGDAKGEIIVPSDTITIASYEVDGSQIGADPVYRSNPTHQMSYWSQVPAYVDMADETRGWGACYEQATFRANFAESPAVIADVNGDGLKEVVAIGNVHDCHTDPYTDHYLGPYVFNADRSRFQVGAYDWRTLPTFTGEPLSEDYNFIERVAPNPAVVDLDGDGQMEVVYPSYDGKVHAFWLDKTERGNWPYSVYSAAEGVVRFASEPAIADLDGDGKAEVIFTSWPQKDSGKTGKLYILDYLGNKLQEIDLPAPFGGASWNGGLPAPTLANIDSDWELEVVVNTSSSGLVAFDLPGTANARVIWGTGRGNYWRTGDAPSAVKAGDERLWVPFVMR